MPEFASLPDFTHPSELHGLLHQLTALMIALLVILAVAGVILGLFVRRETVPPYWLPWYERGTALTAHLGLAAILLIGIAGFSSTLANRYHHWEQQQIVDVVKHVEGDRMEQAAPRALYRQSEAYEETVAVKGRPVVLQRTRYVDVPVPLTSSQIQTDVEEKAAADDPDRAVYQISFDGRYRLTNPLTRAEVFTVAANRPTGVTLLEGYRLEQGNKALAPNDNTEDQFTVALKPGESADLRLRYKAQGGPRWIYDAQGGLLQNFQLTLKTHVPHLEFASGIAPQETRWEDGWQILTWKYQDNVAVQAPFGLFSKAAKVDHTGVLPRLLLLAPAVCLWWWLLIYLGAPLPLHRLPIAAGLFVAMILPLTYLSRLMAPLLAWTILSLIFLWLSQRLAVRPENRRALVGATFCGAVLPVYALLIPYTGLTLSVAGLLSVLWVLYSLPQPPNETMAGSLTGDQPAGR